MPVEASSAICDSCGKILEGEVEGISCTSCETLISAESKSCPICGEKFSEKPDEEAPKKTLNNDEEAMLSQLMTWTKSREVAAEDTVEDKKEREHALHVLRSLTMGETDAASEERMEKIEKPGEKKEDAETRAKQLVMVGKPFEATLEQNMITINQTESELKVMKTQFRQLEGKSDPESRENRVKMAEIIREMEEKRRTLISYQSDILMMGGAYRKLLKEQQGELIKIEAELKKRVEAFRKELERRKKQKERIRKREEALDKREEDLSHRFLDLKKRANEVKNMEDDFKKRQVELKTKEDSLVKWEEEINASRQMDLSVPLETTGGNPGNSKEAWLAEHQKFQADLYKVRSGVVETEKRKQDDGFTENYKKLESQIKEREIEIATRETEVKELKDLLMEKDKEITKLKGDVKESSVEEDTKRILKILDDLLEKLPEEIVDKFAKSEDYLLYEKVLDLYKI
jgi:DNA repair exonuclease SbcCD ATPase subunit